MILIRLLLIVSCITLTQAKEVLRLGNLRLPQYSAAAYLKEPAANCNFQVEEKVFNKGAEMVKALLSGSIDVAMIAFHAAIQARTQGAAIYAIAGFSKGGVRIIAHPKTQIKRLDNLKGKKIGVVADSMQEFMLLISLHEAKISWSEQPGKGVQIVRYQKFIELNPALAQRKVDAISQAEPYASQALAQNIAVEVLKPYQTKLGEPYRLIVVTESLYHNKYQLLNDFLSCFIKVNEMFLDNPQDARKYLQYHMLRGNISINDFYGAIDNSPFSYDLDPEFIQRASQTMLEIGLINKVIPADSWVKLDAFNKIKASIATTKKATP